jgi:cell division protease FtsH
MVIENAHAHVTELLTEHRGQLDDLTHALLAAETLDAPDAYSAAGVPRGSVTPIPVTG